MSSSRTQNLIRSRKFNINNSNSLKRLTAIAYTLCQATLIMSKIKMDIKRFTIKDSKVLNVEDISLYDVKQDEDYFDCIK